VSQKLRSSITIYPLYTEPDFIPTSRKLIYSNKIETVFVEHRRFSVERVSVLTERRRRDPNRYYASLPVRNEFSPNTGGVIPEKRTSVTLAAPLNAPTPIPPTVDGISTEVSPVQFSNAKSPISETAAPKTTASSDAQPANALSATSIFSETVFSEEFSKECFARGFYPRKIERRARDIRKTRNPATAEYTEPSEKVSAAEQPSKACAPIADTFFGTVSVPSAEAFANA
jgi:hypothetical protein